MSAQKGHQMPTQHIVEHPFRQRQTQLGPFGETDFGAQVSMPGCQFRLQRQAA